MTEIDERYKRGKIYTIRNYTNDNLIYVGSTITTLSKRFGKHHSDCKNGCCNSLYNHIDNNDWNNWYIELYEEFPCNNKQELCKREGEVIRLIGSINKKISGRSRQEWKIENKEHSKKINKEYREKNKELIAEKMIVQGKKYREKNKELITKKFKEWYENNKSLILETKKEKCVCDNCGSVISKGNLREHKKTKKCINYQINNNIV